MIRSIRATPSTMLPASGTAPPTARSHRARRQRDAPFGRDSMDRADLARSWSAARPAAAYGCRTSRRSRRRSGPRRRSGRRQGRRRAAPRRRRARCRASARASHRRTGKPAGAPVCDGGPTQAAPAWGTLDDMADVITSDIGSRRTGLTSFVQTVLEKVGVTRRTRRSSPRCWSPPTCEASNPTASPAWNRTT